PGRAAHRGRPVRTPTVVLFGGGHSGPSLQAHLWKKPQSLSVQDTTFIRMDLKGDRLMTATILCYMWPLLVPFLLSCVTHPSTDSLADSKSTVNFAASMAVARSGHTATLLLDGGVLITGGMNGNGSYFAGLETYDPRANRFNQVQDMSERRVGHSATLLPDGKVLIAGGYNGEYLQSAELYDPSTGRTSPTGRLTAPRS